MERIKDIQDALMHVVGWQQAYDPADMIDPLLTTTESGLTFQSAHPFLTLTNMRAAMPDTWGYQYPTWDNMRTYVAGDIVRYNDVYYRALVASVGQTPDSSDKWERYNIFSSWLRQLTIDGITKAVQTFLTNKQNKEKARPLLERKPLFNGAGRIGDIVNFSDKMVGIEIEPIRSMGVTVKIEQIGLQMAGETGTVKMYLYHTSQPEPIEEFELEYTKKGGFQWFTMTDLYLANTDINTNSGGAWYLCYNQKELPPLMYAVNVNKDWSREPCGVCGNGDPQAWRELMKYVDVSPFMQNETDGINPSRVIYTNNANYGINLVLSVGCDLTDFIISQRGIFANAIQRQVAVDALRTLALNPNVRVNRETLNIQQADIMYEIDGDSRGRASGLAYELKQAYEALSLNTDAIDNVCLPCSGYGIKYSAI